MSGIEGRIVLHRKLKLRGEVVRCFKSSMTDPHAHYVSADIMWETLRTAYKVPLKDVELLPDKKLFADKKGKPAPVVITKNKDDNGTAAVITKYNGGKNAHGTYQQIINLIPPHKIYIEPFVGSGAIFRNKLPAVLTVLNDKDPKMFKYWTKQKPPKSEIYNLEALDVLNLNSSNDQMFIYCDPPYLYETRSCQKKLFTHDAGEKEYHVKLLNTLLSFEPGKAAIMISGYASSLYDEMLQGWHKHSFSAMSRNGPRTEVLWMNYKKPIILHDDRYLGNDFRQREKIKIKKEGWLRRFRSLSPEIRISILSTINREFQITK